MSLKKISLEVSLKPFCADMSDDGFRKVARKIYRQWDGLIAGRDVQIMFWTADGSELLDYTGRLEDEFEYARYVGAANRWTHDADSVPLELRNLHERNYLFMANPPKWTYGDLKRLISILKDEYKSQTGRTLETGTTFDPGPEFAISPFKYERHPETLSNMLGVKAFMYCYSTLNADTFHYASYPDGIPQDEPLGRFFGKQTQAFLTDMGFDFIWFSNGFGFGTETWGNTGAVFNGKQFFPEKSRQTSDLVFKFWNDFRKECPTFRVETRGTNLTTGIDLASDAVPLREIYQRVSNLEPPPNSPWAALDANFGLELVGWMSHIAELPEGKGYPFRYYPHDPWWLNSPWLDRYGRLPHDIYLPMAISRLNGKGEVETPSQIDFLSIDNSYGVMPDQVPQEMMPHLLDAVRTEPDRPGPLVWLYPFDEYHDSVYAGKHLDEVFFGDYQMITAVNQGLPLNTIISTRNFLAAPLETLTGRILIAPTLLSDDALARLRQFVDMGGHAILYGPAHGEAIEKMLHLKAAAPLEGELELVGRGKVIHKAVYCGGPLDRVTEVFRCGNVLEWYGQNGERRPAVVSYGNLIWVRGTNSVLEVGRGAKFAPRSEYYYMEDLYLELLARWGYEFRLEKLNALVPNPRLTLRWHENALYYGGYGTNSTVMQQLRFPDGAPIFTGRDTIFQNGSAKYPVEKWFNLEARVFVKDGEDSIVSCSEWTPETRGSERRIIVDGLKNATVVFRPPYKNATKVLFRKNRNNVTFFANDDFPYERSMDELGEKYTLRNVTGMLAIVWGNPPDLNNW